MCDMSAHRQKTILFSVLSNFLFCYRCRFWSIRSGLRRGAGTVAEGSDIWRELRRHNSLDETLELNSYPPTPLAPPTTTQPSLFEAPIQSIFNRLRLVFRQVSLPSLMEITGLDLWTICWRAER